MKIIVGDNIKSAEDEIFDNYYYFETRIKRDISADDLETHLGLSVLGDDFRTIPVYTNKNLDIDFKLLSLISNAADRFGWLRRLKTI